MWTALLDDEVINLESMSPDDKHVIRAETPDFVCRGCGGPVHTRHVPDGNDTDPFLVFAHNPGAAELCRQLGFHTDESDAHHRLKATLAAAARKAGWTADLEVPGDGCRADVVVTKGSKTRVLEAQISGLSVADALERTRRYRTSFGNPLWTHTKRRDWSTQVPSVRIDDPDDTANPVVIGGVMVDQAGRIPAKPEPLATVVPRILDGHLRYLFDADEQFGFFIELAAAVAASDKADQAKAEHGRGAYVKECAKPPVHPRPKWTAPPAAADDNAFCTFTGGSLYCIADPCPNSRHRHAPAGYTPAPQRKGQGCSSSSSM
jgi:hypothetical protein